MIGFWCRKWPILMAEIRPFGGPESIFWGKGSQKWLFKSPFSGQGRSPKLLDPRKFPKWENGRMEINIKYPSSQRRGRPTSVSEAKAHPKTPKAILEPFWNPFWAHFSINFRNQSKFIHKTLMFNSFYALRACSQPHLQGNILSGGGGDRPLAAFN